MICGRCEFMNPTDGACRLPSSGRQVVAYFQEACKARNTQNDNDMKGEKKICQDCARELPLEEFARNRWGYTDHCKECIKAKKEKTKNKSWDDADSSMKPVWPKWEKESEQKPEAEKTLEDTVLEFAVADAREEARKHNEKLQKDAAFICDLPTPILVAELKRRGWSGTLVQHNELTI